MAGGSVSVDAMLADAISKMDALASRMDALEVGEKKIIKGDDDDDDKRDDKKSDSTKADAKKAVGDDDDDDKKDDAISTPKNKILDSAKGASKADAGSSSLKGDDGELEIKHGKDDSAKKADAKMVFGKKVDAKKDDDDDKKDDDDDKKNDDDDGKKDDSVKADSFVVLRKQISDQAAVIARLESIIKPKSDDEHAAFADAQARADAVFSGFGKRAPRPLEGEDLLAYRKRLATGLKAHSSRWKSVKLGRLDDETFAPIETQIYDDAITAAASPIDLEAGELRMVTKIDPLTGVRSNVFYGKESFVKQMGRPGRRVAAFNTRQSV